MPAIRPYAISNRIRLAYKFAAFVRGFVPEHGTIDSLLPAGVLELSPDEHSVPIGSSENDLFSGPTESVSYSTILVSVAGVVLLIEFQAI